LEIHSFATDAEVARHGAEFIAIQARAALEARGSFHFAVSGGTTPWLMLHELATADLPWAKIHLYQVDERIAPDGHPDRNLTHLLNSFTAPLPAENLHAMPVESEDEEAAVRHYAAPFAHHVLDLVHLGLGPDGHTASLVPGDPVLDVTDADIALTAFYQERRRMTMTYPLINRARRILWLVTGAAKTAMTARLLAADYTIPAGRVRQDNATLIAERAALGRHELIP
jgi:6-phosphogluconolactonase